MSFLVNDRFDSFAKSKTSLTVEFNAARPLPKSVIMSIKSLTCCLSMVKRKFISFSLVILNLLAFNKIDIFKKCHKP